MHVVVAASFLVLSGIASLTYQVTWVRLLGLSMGSTSASISTVLAAFFLGMAMGSYLAERITRHRIHSFTPYLVLELLIGISGLMLLPILLHLDGVLALVPAMGTTLSLKFAVALLLLSLPTLCMGATFPVMASILIRQHNEIGLRMSQLYSLNTAGAVLGAALTGFVFIPHWGLDGSIYIAFTINMAIVIAAFYASRTWVLPPIEVLPAATSTDPTANTDDSIDRRRALIILACTGFVSIATQVGWTKYLAIFTGTTLYGFAAILTVFLSGIAVGSWVIKSRLEKIRAPHVWMALGLVLLGLALVATRAGFSLLPQIYDAVNHYKTAALLQHLTKYSIVFALLFIPTFLLGALFPLNLKLYCGSLHAVRARIGKAYAINTVASIFGAIFAGFWFIPRYGTDHLLTLMAALILLLALIFLGRLQRMARRMALLASVSLALVAAWQAPHLSYAALIASVNYQWDPDAMNSKKPKFLYLAEGKAGVISLVTYDDTIAKLQNNGLNESLIHMHDPNQALLTETLLGLVPYMLHPAPKSAFVVGFGGGITTRALTLTDLESIHVVELEPAVVEADRHVSNGEIPALQDPRVRLDFNDARNTLLVEPTYYDLIVAQPSHPWLAGAANVFTRQFWALTKSRLNPDGVFGQWVNLFRMDATTLQSLFQAFYQVYPQGLSFANINTGDLILIGSKQPLSFDYARIARILEQPKIKATLSTHDIYTPADLLWYFALSRNEMLAAAGTARPNTDTNLLSEVRLSALTTQPSGAEDPYTFLRKHFHLDLIPYLGEQAADRLYAQADHYFFWNDTELAEKAAQQLAKIDPIRGRGVEYERAWRAYDYATAARLYAQYRQWPDRTYKQHALLLAQQGQINAARQTLQRIKDPAVRHAVYAQLLYKTKDWSHLAALRTHDAEERKWQLLAVARTNLPVAGAALDRLDLHGADDIPQMLVLLRYYTNSGNPGMFAAKTQQWTTTISNEIERLKKLAGQVTQQDEAARTRILRQVIDELTQQQTFALHKETLWAFHFR
ncbi:MAG: fused MFS/spermidine synthase [Gammaproteobacteria bacterium]|nr:fused MFS/spermidine synthase [Gammaproteobacteria bacterium]